MKLNTKALSHRYVSIPGREKSGPLLKVLHIKGLNFPCRNIVVVVITTAAGIMSNNCGMPLTILLVGDSTEGTNLAGACPTARAVVDDRVLLAVLREGPLTSEAGVAMGRRVRGIFERLGLSKSGEFQ